MNTTGSTSGLKGSRYFFSQVTESEPKLRPWNERMAATNFFRPVAARANLRAASTASVPELVGKTRVSGSGRTSVRAL